MQRRAAAMYAAFFVIIAAGSYAMIGVAQEPAIQVDDPAYSLTSGDQVTVDGRTYSVRVSDGEAELTWTEEGAEYSAVLENDTTVPAVDVQWDGQTARKSVTLRNNSEIAYNDSEYTLVIDGDSFNLTRGAETQTFSVGDEVTYRGNRTVVTQISSVSVTLAWGNPYRVIVADESDPSTFSFHEEQNVTAILVADPAVENEPVTRADGRRYVVFRSNGTTRLLDPYIPAPEVETFEEGGSFTYQKNEVTVGNITAEAVPITWRAPRDHTTTAAEGDNVTLNGQSFVAHFPDDQTLELSRDIAAYQHEVEVVNTFHERVNGLWGVSILSALAAVILLGLAYMPSRY